MLRSAKRCAADPGSIYLGVTMGPGSAEQRDRTMLRIAGRTLHRVRDTRAYRTVTGAGSGGTTAGSVAGTPDGGSGGPAFGPGTGCAEAVVVDAGGAPPGSTTTRVPTL